MPCQPWLVDALLAAGDLRACSQRLWWTKGGLLLDCQYARWRWASDLSVDEWKKQTKNQTHKERNYGASFIHNLIQTSLVFGLADDDGLEAFNVLLQILEFAIKELNGFGNRLGSRVIVSSNGRTSQIKAWDDENKKDAAYRVHTDKHIPAPQNLFVSTDWYWLYGVEHDYEDTFDGSK